MSTPYYAYPNPIFQPAMRVVQSITTSLPAVVTTTFAHLYKTGLIVRLDVPNNFGMQQINQMTGTISVTGPNTFSIDIDSTHFQPFLDFGSWPARSTSYPQSVPVGETNLLLNSAVQNTLPH